MSAEPVVQLEFTCDFQNRHVCTVKNYSPHEEGTYVFHHVPQGVTVVVLDNLTTPVLDDYLLSELPAFVTDLFVTESASVRTLNLSKNDSIVSLCVLNCGWLSVGNFAVNSHLETLSIVGSNLNQIPPSTVHLQRLKVLKIQQSSIRQLHLETVCRMQPLLVLDVRQNKIESIIAADALECSTSLSELRISWNRLKHINLEAFAPFRSLHVLDFSRNNIEVITGRFTNSECSGLSTLYNRLHTIEMCLWAPMPMIETISFQGNKLTQIPECLKRLPNVSSINFASNLLTNVSMESFSELRRLTYLIFIDNPITSFIFTETLVPPPRLRKIYFNNETF